MAADYPFARFSSGEAVLGARSALDPSRSPGRRARRSLLILAGYPGFSKSPLIFSTHMDTSRHPATSYVAGIDGLRAIAVLSVFFFHLNAAWLPGGFVGVDVFFVISGFVVTASVVALRPASLREFFAYFYARRLIRIAPALIVCVVVSMLLASLLIPRAWLSDTNAQTALAALLGFGNIVLAQHAGGYFSERTEFNPFTHTWSLGVEEQFYLIFPLLFFGWFSAQRSGRGHQVAWMFAGLSLLSLACSWYVTGSDPQRAFYWPHTRFWELGSGVVLYVLRERWAVLVQHWAVRTALAASGISLLTLSCLAAAPDRFPFPWALVPVLATAALIAVVYAAPGAVVSRLLSLEPLRWVGRISYSLYLWHWPVFVLMRWTAGLDTPLTWFVASIASALLATVSYYWVETPVRQAGWSFKFARRRILAGGAGAIALSLVTTAVLNKLQPLLSLSVTTDRAAWYPDRAAPDPSVARCRVEEVTDSFPEGRTLIFRPLGCDGADRPARLLVAGDSHAWAYSSMFRAYAAEGREVKVYTTGGCPVIGLHRSLSEASEACRRFTYAAIEALRHEAKPGEVIFLPSLRMQRRANQSGEPFQRSFRPPTADAQGDRRIVDETLAVLAPLAQTGATVVFEAPKPILKAPPFRCSDWFNATNPACLRGNWALPRAELEAERSAILSRMARITAALGDRARVWDPFPVLCPGSICASAVGGRSLYFDGDHLSGFGNVYLFPSFKRFMEPLVASTTGSQ